MALFFLPILLNLVKISLSSFRYVFSDYSYVMLICFGRYVEYLAAVKMVDYLGILGHI